MVYFIGPEKPQGEVRSIKYTYIQNKYLLVEVLPSSLKFWVVSCDFKQLIQPSSLLLKTTKGQIVYLFRYDNLFQKLRSFSQNSHSTQEPANNFHGIVVSH